MVPTSGGKRMKLNASVEYLVSLQLFLHWYILTMIPELSIDARELLFRVGTDDDNDEGWENEAMPLPIGEEGYLMSNAGDEARLYEEILGKQSDR
jgi:hypothetical protein